MAADVRFASGGDQVEGHLCLPASGRGAGVLVLHEEWGLVEHVREVCARLAREGFVALAPDLFRGARPGDPAQARRLARDLDPERAARDLRGAVDALLAHDAVDGGRVGALGLGLGGRLALEAAGRDERIGAVVDLYGAPPADGGESGEPPRLRAAVLGLFGGKDGAMPPARIEALGRRLRAAGARADLRIFEACGRSFLDDTRPDVYAADAAQEAWRHALRFLRAEFLRAEPA